MLDTLGTIVHIYPMAPDRIKSAYLASGLSLQGKSFAYCMASPVIRKQLEAHARAIDTLMARRGEQVPKQQDLAL